MDKVRVARELVKLAKSLVAGKEELPFGFMNISYYSPVSRERIQMRCEVEDRKNLERIKKGIKEYQREEPRMKWVLQTRGLSRDWHNFED